MSLEYKIVKTKLSSSFSAPHEQFVVGRTLRFAICKFVFLVIGICVAAMLTLVVNDNRKCSTWKGGVDNAVRKHLSSH